MYGLLCGTALGTRIALPVGSLESGALLCQVYEAYLELHAPASISFEHAWFLLLALARRDELGIARCPVCGGVRLRDLLAKRRPACANCEPIGAAAPLPSVNEYRRALLEFAPCKSETCSRVRTWSGPRICARIRPGSTARSPTKSSRVVPVWNSRSLIARRRCRAPRRARRCSTSRRYRRSGATARS